MTLQVGRLVLDSEPRSVHLAGDALELVGFADPGDYLKGQALREQLLGYSGNADEPVIPIISTVDPRLNAFVRVDQVDITTTPLLEKRGAFEYMLKGQQTSARMSASFETLFSGALMVNDHGINAATAQPGHGYPSAAWEYSNSAFGVNYDPRQADPTWSPAASGDLTWFWMNGVYQALARYSHSATHFYDGACMIVDKSNPIHQLIGLRESPALANFRLDNGLVRVEMVNASLNHFLISWYNSPGTWLSQLVGLSVSGSTTETLAAPSVAGFGMKVLRNAPEEVVLRWIVQSGGLAIGLIYIDIRLRRGSRMVWFYLKAGSGGSTWTAKFQSSALASTALTGGIRSTTNDAQGNRFVLCTSKAFTADLVNGWITRNSSSSFFDFGVSLEFAGSLATTRDAAQAQIYQYLAAQSERLRVVSR